MLSAMNTHDDVWLVMPLYNEGSVITEVITEARRTFANVVCVDDGSHDDSAAQAEQAGAVVLRHPVNLGQGAALQTGIDYAKTDSRMRYVVTYDADGQHQISDVVAMVQRARASDLQVIFGSRFLDEDRVSATGMKKWVLKAAVAFTNATTHTKLTDAHNGLRVLRREVVEQLDITQNRMAHATEIVNKIGAMRLDGGPVRYAEMPVHILYTDYSKAKGQSLWNAVNILVELIWR